jgi:hypothetical protein
VSILGKCSTGDTYERIANDAVFLENGNGKWKMFFDNPLNEFFVGMWLFSVMGYGVFHGLAFFLVGDLRHCDGQPSCSNLGELST